MEGQKSKRVKIEIEMWQMTIEDLMNKLMGKTQEVTLSSSWSTDVEKLQNIVVIGLEMLVLI